jgi:hypothetical protein
MNMHLESTDARSGNLLVGGNSPDARTSGGTRLTARYSPFGYSIWGIAAFKVAIAQIFAVWAQTHWRLLVGCSIS